MRLTKRMIILLCISGSLSACASGPSRSEQAAQAQADAFTHSLTAAPGPETSPDVLALLQYQEQRIEALESAVEVLHNYAKTTGQIELDRLTAEQRASQGATQKGQ